MGSKCFEIEERMTRMFSFPLKKIDETTWDVFFKAIFYGLCKYLHLPTKFKCVIYSQFKWKNKIYSGC